MDHHNPKRYSDQKNEGNSEIWLDLLGNKHRRKILRLLSLRPMYREQLAKELGITPHAVHKHLQELAKHGIISEKRVPRKSGGKETVFFRLPRKPFFMFDISQPNCCNVRFVDAPKRAWKKIEILSQEDEMNLFSFDQSELKKIENTLTSLQSKELMIHELDKKRMDLVNERANLINESISEIEAKQGAMYIYTLYRDLLNRFGLEKPWRVKDIMEILNIDYDTAYHLIDLLENKLKVVKFDENASTPREPKWKLIPLGKH